MPNRDHGPGQGPSSDEKYGWLYGGDGRSSGSTPPSAPPSSGPRPDARQDSLAPPDLPPPSWATANAGSRPQAPPTAPGGRAARGGRGGGRRTPWGRIVLGVLVLWLVFLVAVPVWAWGKVNKVDAEPAGDRPADQPGTTFLLVGSDSRAGLTKEQRREYATGNAGGGRTDTIMLMHVGQGPTLLLSLPRDSIVSVPGRGRGKINAAYAAGGPELLVQTVEQNTGVRVDDYVEIGFGGFVNVVDAVNGVEICPKRRIKDKAAGLDLRKGCQEANGETALGYSRTRKTFADSDISRVQNQREVLGAISSKAASPWTVVNPVRYVRVAGSGASSVAVGENVGPIAMIRFALALRGAMGGEGLNCTVPIRDLSVRWDRERALQMFDYVKTDRTDEIGDLCTADGQVRG